MRRADEAEEYWRDRAEYEAAQDAAAEAAQWEADREAQARAMILHVRFVDPCGVRPDGDLRYPWSADADWICELFDRPHTGPMGQDHWEWMSERLGMGTVQIRMLAEGSARFENEAIRQEARRRLREGLGR